jgi:hypothetical protein
VLEALDKANVRETDLSAVAVTIGPGLSLCLRGNLSDISLCVLAPLKLSLTYFMLKVGYWPCPPVLWCTMSV